MDSVVWKNITAARQSASLHVYQNPCDTWIWTASPHGLFTLTSAWNIERSPAPIFNLAEVIWYSWYNPKMSCCTLRAIHDRLPTTARLKHFQIVDNDACVLCDTGNETINHLYFVCPYSSYIWTICKLKLGMNSLATTLCEKASNIKLKFKKRNKCYFLSRLVLCGAVWHLWQERNRRIFQYQKMCKILLFRRLYDDIHLMLKTCHWKEPDDDNELIILSNWSQQFRTWNLN